MVTSPDTVNRLLIEPSTMVALVLKIVAIVPIPVILIFLPVTSSYTKSPVTFKLPPT